MSGKRLRILEVNKAYSPHIGGIETLVKQYSEELGKICGAGVKVLVCRDGRGRTVREKINGVSVTRAGSLGTYFKCPLSFSFIRLFRKMAKKADVVHIHLPFPLADVAALLSGYKGRIVVSWHSDVVKQKKLMLVYKPFMRWLLKRADAVIVATEGHVKGSEYLPEFSKKCRVVPYGLWPEDYTSVERKPVLTDRAADKSAVKVFFSGRLVYYKGIDVLLRAFSKTSGCELFISGEGDLEQELKSYAAENGLADRVHFLGFLSEKELRQAYMDCDIFVLPSVARSEAFGIVQIEAMACGKPVINTDLPSGVPYVSLDGKTGITVPPSDEKALAEAINTLVSDKELRESCGRAAAERVSSEFHEKEVIKRLYSVLSERRAGK